MTAKVRYTDDKRTVLLDVEDEAPLPQQYSHSGRTFLPQTLTVEYRRHNGGSWVLSQARANGPVLKKDGTPGELSGKASWSRRDDMPSWVAQLVASNEPTA